MRFDLPGVVAGREVGADTTRLGTVAGATVRLVLMATAAGDTIAPWLIGTVRSDAQGGFPVDAVDAGSTASKPVRRPVRPTPTAWRRSRRRGKRPCT